MIVTYEAKLAALGITLAQCQTCGLLKQIEASHLVDAGLDILARPQRMTPDTFTHWQQMQQAAMDDSISLQLVSAYRSIHYQCELIQKKLDASQELSTILNVNAIPGYSEHHTGKGLGLNDTRLCTAIRNL